jgi:hypothetical protein
MNLSNTTELITQMISNPNLANDIINYLNNIKPKLDQLYLKIPILEQIETKIQTIQDTTNNEYKTLLIKLKNKYDKLKIKYNYNLKDNLEKNTEIKSLQKQISELKSYEETNKNLKKEINSLQEQILELKSYEETNKNLKKEINSLQEQILELKSYENNNKLTEDFIELKSNRYSNQKINELKKDIIELKSNQNYIQEINELKKEIIELKSKEKLHCNECLIKDKLIVNLESKESNICTECIVKDKILLQNEIQLSKLNEDCNKNNNLINKSCPLCEKREKQIYRIIKRNDKIFKEKDIEINSLKEKLTALENQNKVETNELKINNQSSQNILEELSKQFGDFITIKSSK